MAGGKGDDLYVFVTGTVSVVEAASQGFDWVFVDSGIASYTLAANVERLWFNDNSIGHTGTGNASSNYLEGRDKADTLIGLAGNDTLDGGAMDGQVDTLRGGTGNDLYILDDAAVEDTVEELANQGIDTVSIRNLSTYTLGANVENITLLSSGGPFHGNGNELANVIIGNANNDSLIGNGGDDRLVASQGSDDGFEDDLTGGTGNDTYVVYSTADLIHEMAGEGTADSIESYATSFDMSALAMEVENIVIKGGVANTSRSATGNLLANKITGDVSNDVLDGGSDLAAVDTLSGGNGNDIYIVLLNDKVVELAKQGIDEVQTALAVYTLGANVENLTLTGSGAQTGTGNSLNNTFKGTVDGVADTFIGGAGNDTYVMVDAVLDTIVESSGNGTDTVVLVNGALTGYTLAANLENIIITFTSNFDATGNAGNNIIIGGNNANNLFGGLGNDRLDAGTDVNGNGDTFLDVLSGGAGNDIYVVHENADVIVESSNEGTDTVEVYATGFSLSGIANVENITLKNGQSGSFRSATGNDLANIVTGDISDDSLDGNGVTGAGHDTLIGGKGNDSYIVRQLNDVIVEKAGEGQDEVETDVSGYVLAANVEDLFLTSAGNQDGTGNSLNNTLTGNSMANVLKGMAGNDHLYGSFGFGADGVVDTLIGGMGNDTYHLLDNFLDTVVELANQGIDTVVAESNAITSYTLGANVENLANIGFVDFAGTGNALNNSLQGSLNAMDTLTGLAGNDRLDGGFFDTFVEMLTGGTGNDTYVIYTTHDTIFESAGEGTDTVESYDFAYTLDANIENLTILGGIAAQQRDGTGNSLANVLRGDVSDNRLDGAGVVGAGHDVLIGGKGDDTYVVHLSADVVTELKGEGHDTVETDLAVYTLAANVEDLLLTGAVAHTATGNALDNAMTGGGGVDNLMGGAGNDTLEGGAGDGGAVDTLKGGTGNDTYIMLSGLGFDTVVELAGQGTDTVQVANGIPNYTLSANVENLIYTFQINANNYTLTGNTSNNQLTGNIGNDMMLGLAGNDTLYGGQGNDSLDGGVGNDVLLGGIGSDTFVLGLGYGKDVVKDFSGMTTGGLDVIEIHGTAFTSLNDLMTGGAISQLSDGVHLHLDATTDVTLFGIRFGDLQAGDFLFT